MSEPDFIKASTDFYQALLDRLNAKEMWFGTQQVLGRNSAFGSTVIGCKADQAAFRKIISEVSKSELAAKST